jgi:N-acetyl-alpha-D-glucosaminyl L-malate synthase BshA
VVTTLHGTDITLVGRDASYLPITRFGIEASDGVTAVSQSLKDETYRNLKVNKDIEVIPNFVDPSRFHRNESIAKMFTQSDEKLLCHVSNMRPVKRIMDALQCFLGVNARVPSRLLMIGDGPDRSAAEIFCREHRIADRVFFLGNVPDLEDIIGACDLFLLPSETESFGMAALEALASEVPVIATRAGGLPEVVEHGVNGYLVRVGDVPAMIEYALEILSNEELHQRMGKEGRRAAVEKFNVSRVVPHYVEFYERTLRG